MCGIQNCVERELFVRPAVTCHIMREEDQRAAAAQGDGARLDPPTGQGQVPTNAGYVRRPWSAETPSRYSPASPMAATGRCLADEKGVCGGREEMSDQRNDHSRKRASDRRIAAAWLPTPASTRQFSSRSCVRVLDAKHAATGTSGQFPMGCGKTARAGLPVKSRRTPITASKRPVRGRSAARIDAVSLLVSDAEIVPSQRDETSPEEFSHTMGGRR